MKKLTTLLFASASFFTFSQVDITYQVDITDYLAAGNVLDPNGIRVGGDFTTQGATVADWTPSDPTCAMTDMGNNIWSITVTYPASSIGNTQSYKFVNGDWGMNEGTDPNGTIALDGCGIDDGSGNINRQLEIPATALTLTYCWDACTQCDGSPATASLNDAVFNAMTVAPNPANDILTVNFGDAALDNVTIQLFDISGKVVLSMITSSNEIDLNIAELQTGSYIYTVTSSEGARASGKVIKL